MMTRKDYEKLAAAFAAVYPRIKHAVSREDVWLDVQYEVSNVLSEDNPRFSSNRFLMACRGKVTLPIVEDTTDGKW